MLPSKGKSRGPSEVAAYSEVNWGRFYEYAVVAWNIQPSEFWQMCPEEWWLIYESRRPRDPESDFAGSLRESDVEELYNLLK